MKEERIRTKGDDLRVSKEQFTERFKKGELATSSRSSSPLNGVSPSED